MSTPVSSPLAPAISRPVRLRLRGDLTAHRQRYQGQIYWVIKEPVGLNYFRFPEESYYVMNLLDGRRSLEQIQHLYNNRFSPKKLPLEKLQNFIGSLHRAGLLQTPETGQAQPLLKRGVKTRRRKLFAAFGNVLAMRFRGVDPERLLTRLIPYTGWMFSKPAVILAAAGGLAALLSIAVNWEQFMARLPSFHQFFGPMAWFSIAVVLAVTKVLHEFGHGLSCKRLGGECHEMGFMLLVLTPCLYCNVSDSWTMPNKWHRAAIGAAGIYVEVVLASIATLLWWNSSPGFFNQLCLQVMMICSVSTILFNGNPLLRFDGYYILSDILEIPNLQQKSSQGLADFFKRRVLGIKQPQTTMMPTRNKPMFILYAFASILYRWFIVFVIVLFLNRVFEPYGLQVIGQMIAVMAICMLAGMPIYKAVKFFRNPSMRYQIRMRRALVVLGIFVAFLIGVLSIPLPHYVRCDFTVRSKGSENVFVQTPGEIAAVLVQPGELVTKGQPLLQLENLELQRRMVEINGQISDKRTHIASLIAQSLRDNAASDIALTTARQELETLLDLQQKTQHKIEQLQLVAPRDGIIMPVIDVDQRPSPQADRTNQPLMAFKSENRQAYLVVGLSVCAVGDPDQLEAVMSIAEGRVSFVNQGFDVTLKPNAFANQSLESTVQSVGRLAIPPRLPEVSPSGGLSGAVANAVSMEQNKYFATADIDPDNQLGLKVGSQGRARIRSGDRSLGSRIARWAANTFRFQ